MDAPPPCDAVLLAAGSGKRLGLPKALLELQGIWMLPRLVAALRAGGCRSVHVVVRPEEMPILEARGGCGESTLLPNPDAIAGRTGSIQAGLEGLPEGDAVLIHPCDIPLLSADVVRQLLHAWARCSNPQSLLARPVTPG
ncbi:MAG: nucleotidyltransferase family protein, partial [Planctomycetota bacterium]